MFLYIFSQEDISRKTEEEDGKITLEEFATTVLQREDDFIKLKYDQTEFENNLINEQGESKWPELMKRGTS